MKRKIIISLIVILVLFGIGIVKMKEWHDNSVVDFEDETMGQVICNAVWTKDVTLENVTYNDLKNTKMEIEIGYIGYYDTLMDLRHCTGAKRLMINGGMGEEGDAYFVNQGEVNREVSQEEIEKKQQELGKILPKMKELKWLMIGCEGDVEWTSVDFLKNQKSIETIWLYYCKATDYSALKTCTSLKSIKLSNSEISKAEDLIGLEHVEAIYLYGTPLAENEEEINKLKEAYPNANICY